jgi:transglutaminase-like putative cysteine protease
MSRLKFDYTMKILYSVPVEGDTFTLRTIPQSSAVQRVTTLTTELIPGTCQWEGSDAFGNRLLCGRDAVPMSEFYFHETGTVITGLADSEPSEPFGQLLKYKYGGTLVVPGPEAARLFSAFRGNRMQDTLSYATEIMHFLYSQFSYVKGVTNVRTTAEEAIAQCSGVCQDYAHAMIALCRVAGITARYVSGFLIGEGESHAWVEVLHEHRWYGLDPTNNIPAGPRHIRVAVGRDASDCAMNRGIIYAHGMAGQQINVKIRVWE